MKKKCNVNNQKTKILSLILVLLLSICCLLFAGCAVVDPNDWSDDIGGGTGGSGGTGGGSGQTAQFVPNNFKLGYRGTENDEVAEENIKNLASALVEDFASTYGAGKGHGENQNVYYYDSIRYQAYTQY
ncbi:MAG: hypothetical protein ACI4T2_01335, partial [Christensenellales bacterium]